jgi:hypothetical protein
MIQKIRTLFSNNIFQRQRRYLITMDALDALDDLPKSARSFLKELLKRIRSDNDVNALIVTGSYQDFGYKHRTAFYRDRKRLKDAGFIIYEDDHHYVDPGMISYHNRKQRLYLLKEFKLKQDFRPPVFGSNNK